MKRREAEQIAIFGASGFIGSVCAAAFGDRAQGLSSRDADLRRETQAIALARRLPAGACWIFTPAVSPDGRRAPLDGMRDNLLMAGNLARMISITKPAHLAYLSSIDVYGRENAALPLDESSPIRPESYYAISKYTTECILSQACADAGVPLAVVRLPGVYGPGDTHRGPITSFLSCALAGNPLRVSGNGEQRRDLLYVRDIPRILSMLMGARSTGIFNAVTGTSVSLNHMIEIIRGLCPVDLEVHYSPGTPQYDLVFSPSYLMKVVPKLKLTPIEKGIRETYTAMVSELRKK